MYIIMPGQCKLFCVFSCDDHIKKVRMMRFAQLTEGLKSKESLRIAVI